MYEGFSFSTSSPEFSFKQYYFAQNGGMEEEGNTLVT